MKVFLSQQKLTTVFANSHQEVPLISHDLGKFIYPIQNSHPSGEE